MREGEVVRTFRVDGADTIFRYPRLDHLSKGDSTRSAGGWHVRVCAGNLLRAGGPTVDQAEPNPAGMSSVSPKKVLDDFPTPFGEVHFQVVSPVVVKGSKIRQIVDRIGSNCTGHLQRGRRAR